MIVFEMAERVGFEPTVAYGYKRFPDAPVRPLQYLSTFMIGLNLSLRCKTGFCKELYLN